MNFKKLFLFNSLIISSFIFLFFSCDGNVGLGGAIDTREPELEITSPSTGAIIRDKFMMKGSCNDDGTIASITVTLKPTNTEIQKSWVYEAVFNQEEKYWLCAVDPFRDPENPLLDGKYDVAIEIKDAVDRSTVRNVLYTIDNTAPILALTRPSKIWNSDSKSNRFDTFGQDFIIEGHIGDSSESKYISVDIYSLDETDGEGNYKKVYSTLDSLDANKQRLKVDSDISTKITSFGDDIYKVIYGTDENAGSKNYLCSVTAYDDSQRYPVDGSEQSEKDKLGNASEYFYLYNDTDLYNNVFYAYGIGNAYKIKNGTFSDSDLANIKNALPITPAEVAGVLDNPSYQNRYGCFSLNPKNNPLFEVSGYKTISADVLASGTAFDDTEYNLLNNSPATVKIYPGLDQTPLREDTLGLYVYRIDVFGNILDSNKNIIVNTDDENYEKALDDAKIWLVKPLMDVDGNVLLDPVKDAASIDLRNETISSSAMGGMYLLTYYFSTQTVTESGINLKAGDIYALEVFGYDNRGKQVQNLNAFYGFKFVNSGSAPSLTIISVSPDYITTNTESVIDSEEYIKSFGKDIKDTSDADKSETVKENKDIHKASVKMNLEGDRPFIISRKIGDGEETVILENYYETEYTDEYKPDASISGEEIELEYILTSNNNLTASKKVIVKIDNEKPVIVTESIVVPSILQTENTSFKFEGKANENIKNNIADIQMMITDEATGITSGWVKEIGTASSWKYNLSFVDNEYFNMVFVDDKVSIEGKKLVYIRAIDETGNVSDVYETSFIYDTAKPQVKVDACVIGGENLSFNNNYASVAATFDLCGTATDEYGVASVELTQTDSKTKKTKSLIAAEIKDGKWVFPNLPVLDEEETLSSGEYEYKVTVTDKAGKTEKSALYTVSTDLDAPVITIGNSETVIISGSSNRFSGTVSDEGTGVYSYSYAFSKNPAEENLVWKTVSLSSDNWSFYEDIATGTEEKENALCEGSWTLFVKATDRAGNVSEVVSKTFIVDQSNPELDTEIKVSDNCILYNDVYYIKDALSGTVAASDTNSIKSVSFSIEGTEVEVEITNGNWTIPMDSFEEGKVSVFVITAEDIVEKKTSNSYVICKDTILPAFADVVPVSSNERTYLSDTIYAFSGKSIDANLLSVTAVLYKDGTEESTNTLATNSKGEWSWKLEDLLEASYYVEITATDKAGNIGTYRTGTVTIDTTSPASEITSTGLVSISISDSSVAEVLETEVLGQNGTYYSTSAYKLKGSVTDNNYEVDETTFVLKENGITKTATWNNGNWEYTPASFADGKYTYSIVVTDKAGNHNSQTVTVIYDTTAPEIEVMSPTNNQIFLQPAISPKGSVSDSGAGVKDIFYYSATTDISVSDANNLDQSMWTELGYAGGTNWAQTVSLNEQGTVYFFIKAIDNLGHSSIPSKVVFSYDRDIPEVTETVSVEGNYKKGYNFTISGTASDSNKISYVKIVDGTNVYASIGKDADGKLIDSTGTARINVDFINDKELNWTCTVSDGGNIAFADGTHYLQIVAVDTSSRESTSIANTVVIDTVSPEVEIDVPVVEFTKASSISFSGSASDLNLDTVTVSLYKAGAEEDVLIETTAVTTINNLWTYKATEIEDGGKYYVVAQAKDYVGNTSSAVDTKAKLVTVDYTAPVTTLTGVGLADENGNEVSSLTNTGSYFVKAGNDKVTLSGTITDVNSVSGIMLVDGNNNPENITINNKQWSFEDTIESEGTHSFVLKLSDAAGNNNQYTINVISDMTPPETVEITSPVAGKTGTNALSDDSFSFTGRLSDSGSGISKLYYTFSHNYFPPISMNEYSELDASNGNWTMEKVIADGTTAVDGSLYEGNWYLHIKAEDKAGNISEAVSRGFDIDKAAPSIEETCTISSYINKSTGSFTLKGKAWDSQGITRLTVSNGTSVWSTLDTQSLLSFTDAAEEPEEDNWQITLNPSNVDAANYIPNGNYIFVITAEDYAGKRNSVTKSVVVDATAPTVVNNVPSALVNIDESKYLSVNVTVSDGDSFSSGIGGVYYKFTDTDVTPNYVSDNTWVAMAKGAEVYKSDFDITKAYNGSSVDAVKYLWIVAEDNAGNISFGTPTVVTVDQSLPVVTAYKNYTVEDGFNIPLSGNLNVNNSSVTFYARIDDTNPKSLLVDSNYEESGITATELKDSDENVIGYKIELTVNTNGSRNEAILTGVDQNDRQSKPAQVNFFCDNSRPEIKTVITNASGNGTRKYDILKVEGEVVEYNIEDIRIDLKQGDTVAYTEIAAIKNTDNFANDGRLNFTANFSGIADGIYSVYVYAIDKYDNDDNYTLPGTIVIDTHSPIVGTPIPSLTSINLTTKNNDTPFTIGTEITDATSGIETISLTDIVNNTSNVLLTYTAPIADTIFNSETNVFTFSIDKQTVTTGSHTYRITATDKAGNISYKDIVVNADVTPPAITINGISPVVTEKIGGVDVLKVNGKVHLSVSAVDETELKKIEWNVDGQNITDNPDNNGKTFGFETTSNYVSKSWSIEIDTSLLEDEESHTVYLTVTDYADNIDTASYTINVSQITDKPQINPSNASTGITAFSQITDGQTNLFVKGGRLIAAITDDDGIASVNVNIKEENEAGTGNDEVYTPINNPANYNLSYPLPTTDGSYIVTITALDSKGETDNKSNSCTLYVVVDSGAPSFNGMTANGGYYKDEVTITGTLVDTSDIIKLSRKLGFAAGSDYEVIGNFANNTPLTDTFDITSAEEGTSDNNFVTYQATDRWGQSSTYSITFVKDTTAPTVGTPSFANSQTYISNDVRTAVVNVTVTDDGSGMTGGRVYYTIDDSTVQTELTVSGSTYSSPIDFSSYEEGVRTVKIFAADRLENETETAKTITIIKDTLAPEVVVTNLMLNNENGNAVDVEFGNTYYTKTGFTINFESEETATASLTVNNSAATLTAVSAGKWLYEQSLNDGRYTYSITVTDLAGNKATKSFDVVIDHTPPSTVTITAPASGKTGTSSLTDDTYYFGGQAGDGENGTGVAKIFYIFTKDAEAPAGTAAYKSIDAGNGAWTFEKTIENHSTSATSITDGNLAEGKWYLHVKAADKSGNTTADENVVSRYFEIDKFVPAITETSITDNGVYKTNSLFTLSGEVEETNALNSTAAITISNGINSWTVTPVGKTWTKSFSVGDDVNAIEDRNYTFVVTAKDIAGKTSTLTRYVLVDTEDPVISVDEFTGYSSIKNLSFSGTITDDNLKTAKAELYKDGVKVEGKEKVLANGGWNWTVKDLADGIYTLKITAEDTCGNTATYDTSSSEINCSKIVDTTFPTITFQGTGATKLYDDSHNEVSNFTLDTTYYASVVTGGSYTLKGKVSDTNLNKDSFTIAENNGAANSVAIDSEGNWTYTVQTAADGTIKFNISAEDMAGNLQSNYVTVVNDTANPVVAVTVPAKDLSGTDSLSGIASYTFKGTAKDVTSGLKEIKYLISQTEYTVEQLIANVKAEATKANWSDGSIQTESWTVTKTLQVEDGETPDLCEGKWFVYTYAKDMLGNEDGSVRSFWVDLNAPELVITSTIPSYTKEDITIAGTATDNNGITSVVITDSFTPTTAGETGAGVVTLSTDASNIWTNSFVGLKDGTHVFTITATDTAGKVTVSRPQTVVVDKTNPSEATLASLPTTTDTMGSSYTFTGTADDATSGIKEVLITIADAVDATKFNTVKAIGTSNWSCKVTFNDSTWNDAFTTQGNKKVSVKAIDNAGNEYESETQTFMFDTSAPVIKVDVYPGKFISDHYLVKGTASDANKISSIKVIEEKYNRETTSYLPAGKTELEITNTTAVDVEFGEKKDWSIVVPLDRNISTGDQYRYTFIVTDIANNEASSVQYETAVDDNAPVVNVGTGMLVLPTITQTESNLFNFKGNAGCVSDTSDTVTYTSGFDRLDVVFSNTATEPAEDYEPDFSVTPAGDGSWTSTVIFQKCNAFNKEGIIYMWFKAYDKATNGSDWVYATFDYDKDVPKIKTVTGNGKHTLETTLTQTYSKIEDFTFKFTITETNGIAEGYPIFSVKKDSSAVLVKDTDYTITSETENGVTEGSIVITAPSSGIYTYYIEVDDVAGKTANVTRNVCLDTMGPGLSITSPSNLESWQNSTTVTFIGTAADISAVNSVYYYLGTEQPAVPTENETTLSSWADNGWLQANGTESFNFTINGEEGVNTLYYAAVDEHGNTSTATTTSQLNTEVQKRIVKMDSEDPKLTETILDLGKHYKNENFSLGGKTWDIGSHVSKITISAKKGDDVIVWSSDPDESKGEKSLSSYVAKNSEPEDRNWTLNIEVTDTTAANYLPNGSYVFTILAQDYAGRTSSLTRNMVIDTQKPTMTPAVMTIDENIKHADDGNGNIYYNISKLPISANAVDVGDAGLASVEYSLDLSSWIPLSKSNDLYVADVTLPTQGRNPIYVRATDLAGNVSAIDSSLVLYIDTIAPVSYRLKSIDGSTEHIDEVKLVNGKKNIEFTLEASDSGVGLADEDGVTISKVGSKTLDNPVKAVYANGVYKASIPASAIPSTDNTTAYVFVTLKDKVGNYNQYQLFLIKSDRRYPRATISNINDADPETPGTQVNGVITVAGTASDTNDLVSVTLQSRYSVTSSTDSDGKVSWSNWSEWTDVKGDDGKNIAMVESATLNNWMYYVNTKKYIDGACVQFRVSIEDIVGNIGNSNASTENAEDAYKVISEVIVKQDSDVPVIRINNLNLSTSNQDNLDNYFWHKRNDLYGIASDDDGNLQYLKLIAKTGDDVPTDEEWENASNIYINGGWTTSFENDGKVKLYFKAMDATGKVFTSNNASTTAETYGPKIVGSDGSLVFGYAGGNNSDIIDVKVDTKSPNLPLAKAFYIEEDPNPSQLNITKKITEAMVKNPGASTPAWNTIENIENNIHGGAGSVMYIMFTSTDANGIASSYLSVKDEILSVESTGQSKTVPGVSSKNGLITVLYNGCTETEQTVVFKLETSSFGLNTKVEYGAIDKAGTSQKETVTLNCDNTKPEVNISSHKDGSNVFGSVGVTVRGNVTESSKLYYAVTKDSVTDAEGKTVPPADTSFTRIDEYTNVLSWSMVFDGAGNLDTEVSTEYHAPKLNTYMEGLYSITDMITYSEIKPLILWIYAVDDYNNKSEYKKVLLNVNPQGDKPSVSISYPSNNEKVGGTIRVNGSTEIATESVASVWVQIDPDFNGTFDEDWNDKLQALITGQEDPENPGVDKSNSVGYTTVSSITGEVAGLESSNDKFSAVLLPAGIKASGSNVSWNIPINLASEFSKKNGLNRHIGIRVYAISTTGKLSNPAVISCEVDPESPVFGSSEELRLVQFDSEGTEIASQRYTANMWVKGQWYLVGSIEDESGIKSLLWNDEEILGVKTGWYSILQDGLKDAGDYHNYSLKIPVGNVTENSFGSLVYKIKAIEGSADNKSSENTIQLNYDNQAPDFEVTYSSNSSTVTATGNEIYQSDGIYTLNGTFRESSIGKINQSGFNRIAMFFTRPNGDSDKYLVDPMLTGGEDGKANFIDITDSSIKYMNGLYWREATVSIQNNNEVVVSAIPDNVRVGGLCMIDSVAYRIASIAGNVIRVEGSIVSKSDVSAYFALAQIIDNLTTETIASVSAVSAYGSGKDPITNGDGDWMIEGVMFSNGTYNWNASINSSNIFDGLTNMNFVAFDNAGNYTEKVYSGTVKNNGPRFAGVSFGSDDNGDGVITGNELISSYSGLYAKDSSHHVNGVVENGRGPNKQFITEINDITAVLKVKGGMTVKPEIVGGNSGLGWKYSYKKNLRDENSVLTGTEPSETPITTYEGVGHSGTTDIRNVESTRIDLSLKHLLKSDIADGEQEMIFTFYDQTDYNSAYAENLSKNYGYGSNSNIATITIPVKVCLADSTKPVAMITPFRWKDESDNSMAKSWDVQNQKYVMEGHIELEDDWLQAEGYKSGDTTGQFDKDPKVSGKIILSCEAKDNMLITALKMKIPGLNGNNDFITVAVRNIDPESPNYSKWETQETEGCNWRILPESLTEITNQENGNTVNWKFEFDTAAIDGVVKTDMAVEIQVVDRGSPYLTDADEIAYRDELSSELSTVQTKKNSSGEEASENRTPYYRMDVVPYITDVITGLGAYKPSLQRSSSGKYSVNCSEAIELRGFNFGTNPKLYYKNAENGISNKEFTSNGTSISNIQLTYENGSIETGPLTVKVTVGEGGDAYEIQTLNNINRKVVFSSDSVIGAKIDYAAYNAKSDPKSNNFLTDDVELVVWEFKDIAKKQAADLEHPVVKINPANGDIGASFINQYFFNMPAQRYEDKTMYTQTPIQLGTQGMYTASFSYDKNGITYGLYQGSATDVSAQGSYFNFILGQARKQGVDASNTSGATSIAVMRYIDTYRQPYGGVRLESVASNLLRTNEMLTESVTSNNFRYTYVNPDNWKFNSKRISSPVVVPVVDNATNDVMVYVAYADTTTNQIRFRRGLLNPQVAFTGGTGYPDAMLDENAYDAAYREVYKAVRKSKDTYVDDNGKEITYSIDGNHYYIADNSLRDLFDFDYRYRLSNSYGSYYPFTIKAGKSKTSDVPTYPYLNTSNRAYRAMDGIIHVEPADSLATLSGQTIHVVASSGADLADGEIASIYKKNSDFHRYEYSAGKYVGLGVDSNGTALVTWHDEDQNKLLLSHMSKEQMKEAEDDTKKLNTRSLDTWTGPNLLTMSEGGYNITTPNYLGLNINLKVAKTPFYGDVTRALKGAWGTYELNDGVVYKKDNRGKYILDSNGDYVLAMRGEDGEYLPTYNMVSENNYIEAQNGKYIKVVENGEDHYVLLDYKRDEDGKKIFNTNVSTEEYTAYESTNFTQTGEDTDKNYATQLKYITDYTEALNKYYDALYLMIPPLEKYKAALSEAISRKLVIKNDNGVLTEYDGTVLDYVNITNEYLAALQGDNKEEILKASEKYRFYLDYLRKHTSYIQDLYNGKNGREKYPSTEKYFGCAKELSDIYTINFNAIATSIDSISSSACSTANQGIQYFMQNNNNKTSYAAVKPYIEDLLIAYYRVADVFKDNYNDSGVPHINSAIKDFNNAYNELSRVRERFATSSGSNFLIAYTNLLEEYSKIYQRRGDITFEYVDANGKHQFSDAAKYLAKRTTNWENNTVEIDDGGEFVKMIVDSDNQIHMAYYANGALKYAFMESIGATPKVYTVDTCDAAGEYLSLVVGKDENGYQIPYIGYLGGNHAKYAVFNPEYGTIENGKITNYANGSVGDMYTGKWEIITTPTTNTVKRDNINVAVYVDGDGNIRSIPAGVDITTPNTTNTANPGPSTIIHANGSANPIVAYINKKGSLEMAQIKK